MPRLIVCAAEASGDRLAGALVRRLRAAHPDLRAAGIAGPAMRAAGVEPWARAEGLAAIGPVQAAKVAIRGVRALAAVRAEAVGFRPDAVLTVDAPSLLLPLAGWAKRQGWPTLHWVAPQVWAWRPGRADRVARQLDTLLCLFDFELPYFEGRGVELVRTGHPALDRLARMPERPGAARVLLAPGSREGEVRRSWPLLRAVAARMRAIEPGCSFQVAAAPEVAHLLGGLDAARAPELERVEADVAVAATGTVTLELAARGVPFVSFVTVDPITWALGRRLVRAPHLALPNLLAGARVAPEHHQPRDAEALADDALALLGVAGEAQRARLHTALRGALGPDAVGRAAAAVEARAGWA